MGRREDRTSGVPQPIAPTNYGSHLNPQLLAACYVERGVMEELRDEVGDDPLAWLIRSKREEASAGHFGELFDPSMTNRWRASRSSSDRSRSLPSRLPAQSTSPTSLISFATLMAASRARVPIKRRRDGLARSPKKFRRALIRHHLAEHSIPPRQGRVFSPARLSMCYSGAASTKARP